MENTKTIMELVDSLNNSIDDIRSHPTKIDRLPSNFEIFVRGITDSKSLDFLFSDKLDSTINSLFKLIEAGDFEKILSNKSEMESMLDSVFGQGSFRGPVSTAVLNNIQASVLSQKYQTMKKNISNSIVILRKKNLILKNLKRGEKNFDKKTEEYKKYRDAVYAIKNVIKFAERIYKNRKIINKKVFNGLNNIVHETLEYDEPLA